MKNEATAKGADYWYEKRWIALAFLGVSLLLISLDNTILNVALPSISRDLGTSASGLQWILDSYVLVFAAMLLTMGSISDRIGRKRTLQLGLVVFGLCSLMAAFSTSTEMLIAARALLGIGAAMIMPSTLSILTATFRDPMERAKAIAIWATVFGLGMGFGPIIGGGLLEHWEWGSVFLINIPVICAGLIGGYFFIQESKDDWAPKPDIPGVFLSITGLFSLVYGIIKAGEESWTDGNVLITLGFGVVLLTVFGFWERHAPHAMLPLKFFKNMSFTGANIALTLVMFSVFSTFFFMTQYFQSVQGYSPLKTGVLVFPMSLISMFFAINSARIAHKIGTKLTVSIGIFIAGCGLLYLSQVPGVDTSYWIIFIGLCVLPIGMGTAMSPATNSIMGSVPVNRAGVGSAMNDTTRQVGGALGIAILGTIMNGVYLGKLGGLHEKLPMLTEEALDGIESSIQGAHQFVEINGPNLDPQVVQTITETADKAFVAGMTDALFVGGIIMIIAALVTLIIL
ncbi:MAG: MFS transporter, partial [Chloroflexi bacterium]|nr:MFS transporter [Chloroflexota bacterium]